MKIRWLKWFAQKPATWSWASKEKFYRILPMLGRVLFSIISGQFLAFLVICIYIKITMVKKTQSKGDSEEKQ